ncbi:glutaredoxin domain-containing cysteine-rich protein 2 [Electrophorus electricus]|uniref:glutaredoxin domain-containing cysteine-rich protein 2 n=1 Tax=Electrophorus electricus TaxID=8005 RepID=UPI000F0A5A02|nr:glutaredoxin domain-containing cysteine-rich protein 2 [Electrophorus electricus]
MEVPHWNQGPMHEAKPRKVRFKLASSYSGRVLKHVYEDGQELESPGETYPHSFIHAELPRHLHAEQLCGFEEVQELLAKRINIYRGTGGYAPLCYDDLQDGDDKEPVLDFGKIIIYTNNLKIIRGPQKKAETSRSHHRARGEGGESSPGRESRAKGRHRARNARTEEHSPTTKQKAPMKEVGGCEQCGGSGSAPCSVCHGSKLSMLANRFNESIRELRCPACDAHGLERCQSCGK